VTAPVAAEPPRVVDLMEALRKSLDAVSTEKKKPAKATAAAAAPKAAPARKRKAG
jgi:non-homologous end joining protein Ku